jgi:RNA polymerase sigma-70 factor (ECF subfamily)
MTVYSDNRHIWMNDHFRTEVANERTAAAPQQSPDDMRMVALLRERPGEGVAQLYDRYGRVVYSVALRIVHDHGTAEEITQDVFVRCWRSIASYDAGRGSLASWLLTIAHHRAIDVLRSRHGKELRNTVSDERLELLATNDPLIDNALLRGEVQAALHELPSAQREIIELIFWGGFTRREAAERLDIPLGTVHTRLRLGMDKLRATLSNLFGANDT